MRIWRKGLAQRVILKVRSLSAHSLSSRPRLPRQSQPFTLSIFSVRPSFHASIKAQRLACQQLERAIPDSRSWNTSNFWTLEHVIADVARSVKVTELPWLLIYLALARLSRLARGMSGSFLDLAMVYS